MAHYELPRAGSWRRRDEPQGRRWLPILLVLVFLALLGARTVASYILEYHWWEEMGQVRTWIDMLLYSLAPVGIATLLAFIVLLAAHVRGMKFAGVLLGDHSLYAKLSTVGLLVVAIVLASATIETWTVVRYFGGRNLPLEATAWHDSVFGQPLGFYLFTLPFYGVLRGFLLAVAVVAAITYWVTARGWQLRDRIADFPG